MERVLSAPRLIPEINPFQSPASQKWITSRSEWKEDLKRTGNIPYEKGMQEDIAKNKAHKLETAFKPIADAVDSKVAAMVASGHLEN